MTPKPPKVTYKGKEYSIDSTYQELLDAVSYADLGYTGETPLPTDQKYKSFTDTISRNKVIAQTRIDPSMPNANPTIPLADPSKSPYGNPAGTVRKKQQPSVGAYPSATTPTTGNMQQPAIGADNPITAGINSANPTATPSAPANPAVADPIKDGLTVNSSYAEMENWAKAHGIDTAKLYQDALAKARADYEQQKATYGRNAEQLAQKGLTNSGVSDNMDRVAYAQKVNAEQAALEQKAQGDLLNRQQYDAYQEQQTQKQAQYNQAYQQLMDGYTDENGRFQKAKSPENAVALLKYAGFTDDTLIAQAQTGYDAIKAKQTSQNGASDQPNADLLNLAMGDDDEAFLSAVSDNYGVNYETSSEAVEAMFKAKELTLEQRQQFYKSEVDNAVQAIVNSPNSAKYAIAGKTSGEVTISPLIKAIETAKSCYETGRLSKADWDAFRKGITSGDPNSPISIRITGEGIKNGSVMTTIALESASHTLASLNDKIICEVKVGDKTESFAILNGIGRRVGNKKWASELDRINEKSGNTGMVEYDGKFYVKFTTKAGKTYWSRLGRTGTTKRNNFVNALKMLSFVKDDDKAKQ